MSVDNQAINDRYGGRPAKEEAEKSSVKINCWITPGESAHLIERYNRVKAGRKIAFSTFLKQILLRKGGVPTAKSDEFLLTILIQLQQQINQLDAVKNQFDGDDLADDNETIRTRIDDELNNIRTAITQITAWLYES